MIAIIVKRTAAGVSVEGQLLVRGQLGALQTMVRVMTRQTSRTRFVTTSIDDATAEANTNS